MRRFLLALMALAGVCCGGGAELPAGEVKRGWAEPSCAPWDGPAVALYLPEAAALPDSAGNPPRPFLAIAVYRSLDLSLGRRIEVGGSRPNRAEAGAGTYCPAAGDCESASRGEVRINPQGDSNDLTGTYRLVFPSGRVTSGRFLVYWNARRVMCG